MWLDAQYEDHMLLLCRLCCDFRGPACRASAGLLLVQPTPELLSTQHQCTMQPLSTCRIDQGVAHRHAEVYADHYVGCEVFEPHGNTSRFVNPDHRMTTDSAAFPDRHMHAQVDWTVEGTNILFLI